jgi:hypothetical protein
MYVPVNECGPAWNKAGPAAIKYPKTGHWNLCGGWLATTPILTPWPKFEGQEPTEYGTSTQGSRVNVAAWIYSVSGVFEYDSWRQQIVSVL